METTMKPTLHAKGRVLASSHPMIIPTFPKRANLARLNPWRAFSYIASSSIPDCFVIDCIRCVPKTKPPYTFSTTIAQMPAKTNADIPMNVSSAVMKSHVSIAFEDSFIARRSQAETRQSRGAFAAGPTLFIGGHHD
ncbi:MAG TPA: hypothetical protein VLZ30_01785 [Verrucomicrobiae bacterium]|nr:hypothetical protein [Verrucomicrobiae bacterium]